MLTVVVAVAEWVEAYVAKLYEKIVLYICTILLYNYNNIYSMF